MIYHVIACHYMCNILRKCSYQALQLWRPELWIVVLLLGNKLFIPFELITLPVQFGNALPQKYGRFGKYNGNARIWQFDLLELAWHQPQTGIVALMQHSRVVLWTKDAIHTHAYVYIYIFIYAYPLNQYNSIWFIFDNLLYDFNRRSKS